MLVGEIPCGGALRDFVQFFKRVVRSLAKLPGGISNHPHGRTYRDSCFRKAIMAFSNCSGCNPLSAKSSGHFRAK